MVATDLPLSAFCDFSGLKTEKFSSKAKCRFCFAPGWDLLVPLLLASFFYAPDLPFLVNTPVLTPIFSPALVGSTFVFPVMPPFDMPLAGFLYTPGWLHVRYAPSWTPVWMVDNPSYSDNIWAVLLCWIHPQLSTKRPKFGHNFCKKIF